MTLTVTKGVWFLMRDGTRRKMQYEQIISPTLSIFREQSPTDRQAWFTDGKSTGGIDAMNLVMRDHCQYDNYGPIPTTINTPTSLVVTLLLRCEVDKTTNVIKEGIVGGPGMDAEALVRYAYAINGKAEPDAEGLAWWVTQINTGRWRNFVDCLLGINAVFKAAKP